VAGGTGAGPEPGRDPDPDGAWHLLAGILADHLPTDDPRREERIAAMYREIDLRGIHFMRDETWAADFPSFYQNTLHAPWYVFEHWSRFLEIASYIPRGSLSLQDMVVLRHKRADGRERTWPAQAVRVPA
jgi:hypothetical protein